MPSTTTRTDTDDNFNWTEIQTTFNDDGLRTGIRTAYDNGIVLDRSFFADGFTDPNLPDLGPIGEISLRTDLPVGAGSVAGWDSILTYYSHDTPTLRLFDRQIDDTGLEKSRTYDADGNVVRVVQVDTGNVKGWASVEQSFGASPLDVSTRIVYDNGDIYEKTEAESEPGFEFLVTRTERREDVSDQQDYVYSTESYLILRQSAVDPTLEDIETLLSSETLYDDGVHEIFVSMDGSDNDERIKTDTLDAYDWETITIVEMPGDLTRTTTVFDDGREHLLLEDPLTDLFVITNAAGEEESVVSHFYYESGQVAQRSSSGIDETGLIKSYSEDGLLTQILEYDDTYDVRNFEFRGIYFDAEGRISQRTTLLDNGVLRNEKFTDGVRTSTETTDRDDVYNYETRTEIYDANGHLSERLTVSDDFVSNTETFVGGERVLTVIDDLNDTRTFETITIAYDPSADTVLRNTVYDNGLEMTDIRVGGVLQSRTQVDQSEDGSLRNFTEKTSTYDANGDLEKVQTKADSGDEFVFIYGEDRALETRIEYDGNMSHDWAFKVTEYDADDGPVVTFYDSIADAPMEIVDEFGFIAAV